ncbi:hypothetical protein OQA88_5818 [Cercophora sp. LCS_1]
MSSATSQVPRPEEHCVHLIQRALTANTSPQPIGTCPVCYEELDLAGIAPSTAAAAADTPPAVAFICGHMVCAGCHFEMTITSSEAGPGAVQRVDTTITPRCAAAASGRYRFPSTMTTPINTKTLWTSKGQCLPSMTAVLRRFGRRVLESGQVEEEYEGELEEIFAETDDDGDEVNEEEEEIEDKIVVRRIEDTIVVATLLSADDTHDRSEGPGMECGIEDESGDDRLDVYNKP